MPHESTASQKLLCSLGPAASALTVDFVVNLKDECRSPLQGDPLPIMGPHKSAMFRDILFPFPEFYRDWDGMVASMRNAAVPWDAQQVVINGLNGAKQHTMAYFK